MRGYWAGITLTASVCVLVVVFVVIDPHTQLSGLAFWLVPLGLPWVYGDVVGDLEQALEEPLLVAGALALVAENGKCPHVADSGRWVVV